MDKVEKAASALRMGEEPEEVRISTGGRPLVYFDIGGVRLNKEEMAIARGKVGEHDPEVKQLLSTPKVMSPEQLVTFARAATPALVHRAVSLALLSDDPKTVLAVAKELADRGYGKVADRVQVSIADDIAASWRELEEYKPPLLGEIDDEDN